MSQLGTVIYKVKVEKGNTLKRHIDGMCERLVINKGCTVAQSDATAIQDDFH